MQHYPVENPVTMVRRFQSGGLDLVYVLPPERVDWARREFGDSVRVADLPAGAGYRIVSDPERPVAVVAAPVEEKVETAAPATEITEPELIRKGKEEPEEGGEEPAPASAKKEKEKE